MVQPVYSPFAKLIYLRYNWSIAGQQCIEMQSNEHGVVTIGLRMRQNGYCAQALAIDPTVACTRRDSSSAIYTNPVLGYPSYSSLHRKFINKSVSDILTTAAMFSQQARAGLSSSCTSTPAVPALLHRFSFCKHNTWRSCLRLQAQLTERELEIKLAIAQSTDRLVRGVD